MLTILLSMVIYPAKIFAKSLDLTQEASEVVKDYPAIKWQTIGLPPLRIALVLCVIVTAVGGILSNPLFQWANSTVAGTPLLQEAIALGGERALG